MYLPGPATLAAIPPSGSVRWLGVWLDTKLTFYTHVAVVCAKAKTAMSAFVLLGSTLRDANVHQLRKAYLAAARPILLYAAAAWWRGLHRVRGANDEHVTGIQGAQGLLWRLQSAQNHALRRVPHVYRTTSILALQREACVPPIEIALHALRESYSLRVRRLPRSHPLLRRRA